ncbi:MAG: hypothetical protein ACJ763_15905 [Bdellovibrionia bacterium]
MKMRSKLALCFGLSLSIVNVSNAQVVNYYANDGRPWAHSFIASVGCPGSFVVAPAIAGVLGLFGTVSAAADAVYYKKGDPQRFEGAKKEFKMIPGAVKGTFEVLCTYNLKQISDLKDKASQDNKSQSESDSSMEPTFHKAI